MLLHIIALGNLGNKLGKHYKLLQLIERKMSSKTKYKICLYTGDFIFTLKFVMWKIMAMLKMENPYSVCVTSKFFFLKYFHGL